MARIILYGVILCLLALPASGTPLPPGAKATPGAPNFQQHIGERADGGVRTPDEAGYVFTGASIGQNCFFIDDETSWCSAVHPVVPGDVVLLEYGTFDPNDPSNWSDVLRFGPGGMVLYSDSPLGFERLLPLHPNHVWIMEDSSSPTAYYITSDENIYFIYSDPARHPDPDVPEPATLLLLGTGLALLARRLKS